MTPCFETPMCVFIWAGLLYFSSISLPFPILAPYPIAHLLSLYIAVLLLFHRTYDKVWFTVAGGDIRLLQCDEAFSVYRGQANTFFFYRCLMFCVTSFFFLHPRKCRLALRMKRVDLVFKCCWIVLLARLVWPNLQIINSVCSKRLSSHHALLSHKKKDRAFLLYK